MSTLQTPFLAMERELNQVHFERPDVIRSLIVALLARQHVILLGPPGTGKSRLVRDLCQRMIGRFFEWQLTRMSTPCEGRGPRASAHSMKRLVCDSATAGPRRGRG